MSGEGIGGAVAMVAFAAGAVAWYGIKGAAWLTYHGVKGVIHAGKAVHSAYVASEANRRAKALEELKAVDGIMARSTESLLEEIRLATTESEKLRAVEIKKMDDAWELSLSTLESKRENIAEALMELHEFHTRRTHELTKSIRFHIKAKEEQPLSHPL